MFKKLFSKKRKPLEITFSNTFKRNQVTSHAILKIGNKLYYRKDEVERRMADVINLKIQKGELKEVKTDGKN